MAKKPVQFELNGEAKAAFADDGQNLLEFLRREVGDLTPKFGCGQGTCGACTVLIDGEPHLSCLMLAEVAEGQRIETTAGLSTGGNSASSAGSVHGALRGTVRLLHAGHADGRESAARSQSAANARRDRRGDLGQPVPVHGL